MSDYRLYVFDRLARIVGAVDIHSETDHRAITAASRYISGRPMELWSQDRFIKSFDGVAAHHAAPTKLQKQNSYNSVTSAR